MKQEFYNLKINTNGQRLYEFTDQTLNWIEKNNFKNGILNLSIQHTSASIIVQENSCRYTQQLNSLLIKNMKNPQIAEIMPKNFYGFHVPLVNSYGQLRLFIKLYIECSYTGDLMR